MLSVTNTRGIMTPVKTLGRCRRQQGLAYRPLLYCVGALPFRGWLRAAGFAAADMRRVLSQERELAAKLSLRTLRNPLTQRPLVRANIG